MNSTNGAARRTGALLVALLMAVMLATPGAAAQAARPTSILVPSETFRTIQQAINAAPPGATVQVQPGVYHEALVISKPLTLIGAGPRRTELVGDRTTEVPPADRARGVVTVNPGGDSTIADMTIRGGEAAIRGVAPAGSRPAAVRVKGVAIEGAGRGILGSFANLAVLDSWIGFAVWNGVSILAGDVTIENTTIQGANGAGLFVWDPTGAAHVRVIDSIVQYNGGPGIAVYDAHFVRIVDSYIFANHEAGVKLVGVDEGIIDYTTVSWTHPRAADGAFGSGVNAYSSGTVTLVNSKLQYNVFGLINFGSSVAIADTLFYLNELTLNGAPFQGSAATFDDQGANTCYERDGNGQPQKVYCQIKTLDLAPPDALTDPQP